MWTRENAHKKWASLIRRWGNSISGLMTYFCLHIFCHQMLQGRFLPNSGFISLDSPPSPIRKALMWTDMIDMVPNYDPLQWWKQNESVFPTWASCAHNVLQWCNHPQQLPSRCFHCLNHLSLSENVRGFT